MAVLMFLLTWQIVATRADESNRTEDLPVAIFQTCAFPKHRSARRPGPPEPSTNNLTTSLSVKQISFIAVLLLATFNMHAQSLERRVIASGGASVTGPLAGRLYDWRDRYANRYGCRLKYSPKVFSNHYTLVIPGNNVFPYLVIYPNPTQGIAIARFILSARQH